MRPSTSRSVFPAFYTSEFCCQAATAPSAAGTAVNSFVVLLRATISAKTVRFRSNNRFEKVNLITLECCQAARARLLCAHPHNHSDHGACCQNQRKTSVLVIPSASHYYCPRSGEDYSCKRGTRQCVSFIMYIERCIYIYICHTRVDEVALIHVLKLLPDLC